MNVNDPTVGGVLDVSRALSITVTDVVETTGGTAQADIITGGFTGERILGLDGNDTINGAGGDDVITGGSGVDRMTGGTGADTFVFTSTNDSAPGQSGYINNGAMNPLSGKDLRDIITDFQPGVDKIDLSAIDANTVLTGNQAFTFIGTGSFAGTAGQICIRQFDASGTAEDVTVIYGDVDGDKLADFQIELTGLKALAAGDFVL